MGDGGKGSGRKKQPNDLLDRLRVIADRAKPVPPSSAENARKLFAKRGKK